MTKVTMELQEAFETLQRRIDDTQALALSMIGLNKMILRAFVDLDLVTPEEMAVALHALAQRQGVDALGQVMLRKIAAEYELGTAEGDQEVPHLRLVKTDPAP